MSATRRADAVRAVSGLSDEQQAAAAVGHLRAAERQELRTCHYTPIGQPCTFSDLLSAVAGSIVKVRRELEDHPRPVGPVMTRKAILDRASYARRRLASTPQVR